MIRPYALREQESLINVYRIKRGLTLKALSALAGVEISNISLLTNGTASPLSPRGNGIKRSAQKIAAALEVPVAVLFPRYFCLRDRKKLTCCQVTEILMPGKSDIDRKDFWRSVYRQVTRRQFFVLRMLSLGCTLEEIGGRYGITREGVRLIEVKALRTLRRRLKREDI